MLQHPPYGPIDGNIYVGNLRGAKATDQYTCKGDDAGEVWAPIFTQHGFRYVEVTGGGPGLYGGGGQYCSVTTEHETPVAAPPQASPSRRRWT